MIFLNEESGYQEYFKGMLQAEGVSGLGELKKNGPEAMKAFFAKVKAGWAAKKAGGGEKPVEEKKLSEEASTVVRLLDEALVALGTLPEGEGLSIITALVGESGEEPTDEDLQLLNEMTGGDIRIWWKKIGGGWFKRGENPEIRDLEAELKETKTKTDQDNLVKKLDHEIIKVEEALKNLSSGETANQIKSGVLSGFFGPVSGLQGGTPSAVGSVVGSAVGGLVGMVGGPAGSAAGAVGGRVIGGVIGTQKRIEQLKQGLREYLKTLKDIKVRAMRNKK